MDRYKLGLVSISFRQNSPEEILSAMREAGLSYIEWGSDVHAPSEDGEALRRVARLQKASGVTCASYGTYFRVGQTELSELDRYIDGALTLETDLLRLWAGTKPPSQMTSEEEEALIETCARAAAIAERRGVTLALECHRNTYTEEKETALRLMREVGSKHLRMYWQPAQWRTEAENADYASAISPYVERLHVFNWKDDMRLPLAEGVAPWRRYLTAFEKNAYLLLEFMPDNDIASLPREADALREIVR